MSDSPRQSAPLLDPGWLFLIAGVVLLAATVLIPAQNDLDEARFYLQRAQAIENHRQERMGNYAKYIDALNRGDEGTVRSLAAMQLNKAPDGMALLMPSGDLSKRTASVFASLEPQPLVLPERTSNPSRLERWATDDRTRLWMIAGGAMCVLIGLLPPTTRPAPTAA